MENASNLCNGKECFVFFHLVLFFPKGECTSTKMARRCETRYNIATNGYYSFLCCRKMRRPFSITSKQQPQRQQQQQQQQKIGSNECVAPFTFTCFAHRTGWLSYLASKSSTNDSIMGKMANIRTTYKW